MRKDYLSVRDEPALNDRRYAADPAEGRAATPPASREEIDRLRDSVANEPWQDTGPGAATFADWLERKRRETSGAWIAWCTLVAALAGGIFAVLGAFVAGQQGLIRLVYVVVFGPVAEELLKQSGMIYLLERRPYRVVSAAQFVFAGAVSALIFASIENLLYVHVYTAGEELADPEAFARFRWTVCTALHVSCSVIASLGLVRVWRQMLRRNAPADLSFAFPLFVVAIAVHGVYNFFALFFSDIF